MTALPTAPAALKLPPAAPPPPEAAAQLAAWLAERWPAQPARISHMKAPGAPRKYQELKEADGGRAALILPLLQQHAAGRETLAAAVHGAAGLARVGAIDVDQGGAPALAQTLAAAGALGLAAFAITSTNAQHQGGAVWLVFSAWAPIADVAALVERLRAAAGLPDDTECWPRNQAIRLPFGVHRWTHRRGDLLLPSGELVELDTPEGYAAGLAALLALPENAPPPPAPAPPEVERPAPRPLELRRISPGEQAAENLTAAEIAARFCADHPLAGLLERYGAAATRDGYTCPCGVPHSHKTTITIAPGGDRGFSHSPRCKLYNPRGFDSLNVYTALEHGGDLRAAIRALSERYSPRPTRQPRATPPPPEAPPGWASDRERRRRTQERARERAARLALVERQRAALVERAESDALPSCARRALAALLACVRGSSGRPSIARLADSAGCTERTIQRGMAELERAGYIRTEEHRSSATGAQYRGGPATAVRHFVFEAPQRTTTRQTCAAGVTARAAGVTACAACDCELAPLVERCAQRPITRIDHEDHAYTTMIACERAPEASDQPDAAAAPAALGQHQAPAVELERPAPASPEDAPDLERCASFDPAVYAAWETRARLVLDQEPGRRRWTPNTRPSKLAELRAAHEWATRPASTVIVELPPPPEVEQPEAQPAPAPARPSLDHYRQRLTFMTAGELAGEIAKQRRAAAKHSGKRWARDIRRRLEVAEEEQGRRAAAQPLALPDAPEPDQHQVRPSGSTRRRAGRSTSPQPAGAALPLLAALAAAGVPAPEAGHAGRLSSLERPRSSAGPRSSGAASTPAAQQQHQAPAGPRLTSDQGQSAPAAAQQGQPSGSDQHPAAGLAQPAAPPAPPATGSGWGYGGPVGDVRPGSETMRLVEALRARRAALCA